MLNEKTLEELRAASGPPTDLARFGEALGVVEVEWKELNVDGMVLPKGSGYKIVLNSKKAARARFSWAHELGHIVFQSGSLARPQFRSAQRSHKQIERLCDMIASEVLMPREQFSEHMNQLDFTLAAVPKLAQVFDTSIVSTAIRYTDLLPFPAVLSVWKSESGGLTYSWSHDNGNCRPFRFNVPKGTRVKEGQTSGPNVAFRTADVVRTEESLQMSHRSRGSENHKQGKFPTDSMGIGSYQNRYVLSLSYVSVPSAEKANRREPPT